MLTEFGKLLIYHYDIIDSGLNQRKYFKHLAGLEQLEMQQVCGSRLDSKMKFKIPDLNVGNIENP